MSGTPGLSSFVLGDYLIFALMLLVSAAVGVYYAWKDRDQRTSGDFLMGGKKLTALPVAMSLTASFMSAITVLSTPAEVYRFGAIIAFSGLSYVLAMIATSEIFLPVFYRLGITSTYEVGFILNKACMTHFLLLQVLYTGIVIYTPALALTQVTGIDLWGAIVSTGLVCTFYCTMGGLKAVVWTDVFQVGVMLAGFLAVIVQSVILQGGIFPIIKDSQDGGRLNFWDFDMNPLRRHTFWTITIGATFVWSSIYGVNQAQVQRYISCKSLTHARLSLYINLCGLWCIMLCSVFAGLCLYSIYKSCDPWTSGLISAPDQLMPYLVMDILRGYPGLPGLFVAAAYSGSLSTVSSSINALAAVTVEDLIKPYTNLSEKQLCYNMFHFYQCTSKYNNLMEMYNLYCFYQAVISIFGVIGGPLLGLFTLGILCPFANSKGAISGLVLGLMLSLWVAIGSQLYPPPPELTCPLPLITKGCNFTNMDIHNWTSTILLTEATTPIQHLNSRYWYSLSYVYFSPIGTITVVCVGLLVSFFSGKDNFNIFQISEFQMTILTSYATTKQGSLYINNKHDRA
uniref:Solute carrier family 5 member 8 n=1 Tax=Neogobius melanostomus TaxID=47308 RepID=A0A8C6TWN9_9GOBI